MKGKIICLNKKYSTTRLLTKERPVIESKDGDKFKTVLFLTEGEGWKGEGGLRRKGYFKKSYQDKPLITVITVVFNGEKYLEETIKSVINQTYDNVEYIIIDGGSTDGTLDIIKKYDDKIDYWVSEKDNGLSDAMNKGVKCALGKYILHLHADDTFVNDNSLEFLLKELLQAEQKWISGLYKYKNSLSRIIKSDKFHNYTFFDMQIRNIIRHQSTIVPKYVFNYIRFNSKFKYAMDYNFFLNVWMILGRPKFTNRYVSFFRLDGKNLSSNYYKSLIDEMRVRMNFRKKYKNFLLIPLDIFFFLIRFLKILFYHSLIKIKKVK